MSTEKAPKPLKSWDEVNNLVGEIGEKENQLATLQAEKDEKARALETEYSGMSNVKDEIQYMKERIRLFAESHRNEMKDGKKKELPNGDVYFRSNPSSVKIIDQAAKGIDAIIGLLKKSKKWAESFLVTKTDIDKSSIKKAYESGKINDEALAKFGLAVEKSEGFYVKPNP